MTIMKETMITRILLIALCLFNSLGIWAQDQADVPEQPVVQEEAAPQPQLTPQEADLKLKAFANEKHKICPIEEESGIKILMIGYESQQLNVVYRVTHEIFERIKGCQSIAKRTYVSKLNYNKERKDILDLVTKAEASLSLVVLDNSLGDEAMDNALILNFPLFELQNIIKEVEN